MIKTLSSVLEEQGKKPGPEVTVRCRIRSTAMPGETAGDKTVYLVDDPYNEITNEVALSFWDETPEHEGIEQTEPYVLSALQIPSAEELERTDYSPDGVSLQRGEELLVRAVPNRGANSDTLFLNVTSFVIREPDQLISKSKLRTQDRCPREYYLRYVKRVYSGDKFETPPHQQVSRFRGDAVHQITENALQEEFKRFEEDSWDEDSVEQYCEKQFESEFGFRQALLVLSQAGLTVKDHVVEVVHTLFTDQEFLDHIQTASSVDVEQFLSDVYGYAGRVDILLDEIPYDIKTTRNPDESIINRHSRQIKLYLFALLLERIDQDESFQSAIDSGEFGFLIYPNTSGEEVQFERVQLSMDDVKTFLRARNDVIETGDTFAPPSTYNRECEGCAFAEEEEISGEDDTLPSACTYHCQNERRWPCYEFDGVELQTECSLFDRCEQRTKYRDPDVIDHFESVRVAFQEELNARKTAKRVIDQFDHELLVEAGYIIPNLQFAKASAVGTVLRFTTDESVVPGFDPGEIVELRDGDNVVMDKAVYYGQDGEEYLFQPVDESFELAEYLRSESAQKAVYSFGAEAINERYLPYLDYAQRRNGGEPVTVTDEETKQDSIPDTISPSALSDHLDHERLFIDVPVDQSRNEIIGNLIKELSTTTYSKLDGTGEISPEACRTLVLGTRPQLVECAVSAQPDGPHYRLDETGGSNTIQNDDGYHEIQDKLLESRSIVSSVFQATSNTGPGGVREFFHKLTEGSFGNRDHSDNFFDVLVLLGSENITEPEYHFLADIADRVIAVGDTRRKGSRMLSTTAEEAGLAGFFQQEFERYRSFPTESAISFQVDGDAPTALDIFYQEGPWETIGGQIEFLDIEGAEETSVEGVELTATVDSATGSGRRLVFDVTDTPLSPMEAHELFENRIELDSTVLSEQQVIVLDEKSLFLESKERLKGEHTNQHQIVIRAEASELPQFSQALLSNRIEEQIVVEVAKDKNPDIVITPFGRHATHIKRRLEEQNIEVPVKRPEELDGTIKSHAVISFATSNEADIVRPPLDSPSILYSMLSSARDLTLIGNKGTLESKDLFERLIEKSSTYEY